MMIKTKLLGAAAVLLLSVGAAAAAPRSRARTSMCVPAREPNTAWSA